MLANYGSKIIIKILCLRAGKSAEILNVYVCAVLCDQIHRENLLIGKLEWMQSILMAKCINCVLAVINGLAAQVCTIVTIQ